MMSLTEEKSDRSKASVVLFLGAGASAPIGFPTTRQLVKNIGLEPYDEKTLKRFFWNEPDLIKKFYERIDEKDIEGLYLFVRSFSNNPQIEVIMDLFKDFEDKECFSQLRERIRMVSGLERNLNRILNESYDYEPEKHEEKAVGVYKSLFEFLLKDHMMGELSELLIFTTNYDVVIENMFKLLIPDNFEVTDGFKCDKKSGEWIFDDNEFTRLRKTGKRVIKLYKLHGSMNWAIRKSDNVLVKKVGISVFRHPGYTSPVLTYPGDHQIQLNTVFSRLTDHFYEALRNASICIVIGFSFRDRSVINKIFEDILRGENKTLFIEISSRTNNFSDLKETNMVFSKFKGRYDYHGGGIKKLEKQLRKKYNLKHERRESEMKLV